MVLREKRACYRLQWRPGWLRARPAMAYRHRMWADGVRALLDVVAPVRQVEPSAEEPARSTEAPGDPEAYRILYSEAVRAIEGQRAAVDELRSRAGLYLSALAIATAFIGPDKLLDASRTPYGLVAASLAALSALLLLWVMQPVRGWRFDVDFQRALLDYVECDRPATPAEMYRSLAWFLDRDHAFNGGMISRRYWIMTTAVFLAVVQIVLWVIAINVGAS